MPEQRPALPWVIAHRGARQEAPENTRSAFERALAYPVDGIEFDVQMSADGVPVVCHDPTLHRINGSRRRVSSCTHAELAALDWGGWFDSGFAGEPLSTLEKTLAEWSRRTRLLVEIKADHLERRTGKTQVLARKVADLLSSMAHDLNRDRVYILSFDPDVLQTVHRLVPHCRLVLNVTAGHAGMLQKAPDAAVSHLWAVDVAVEGLSSKLVTWAHDHRLNVLTYTCNSPRTVARAMSLGVDGIISDRPGWLTGVFNA